VRHYVDTSAAAKLPVDEPESDALAAFLERVVADGDAVGSSLLLETELRRLGIRSAFPATEGRLGDVVLAINLAAVDYRQGVTPTPRTAAAPSSRPSSPMRWRRSRRWYRDRRGCRATTPSSS
jgi:uncharacterized protein